MSAFVCAALFSSAICVHAGGRPTCAVLTFDAGEGITSGEAKFVSDRFAAFLTQGDRYKLVARSRMAQILSAARFNRMGHCSAADCAVEAGQILQVKYMVFGSVGHVGRLYSLNTSLVDVETGEIVNTAVSDYEGEITQFARYGPHLNVEKLLGVELPYDASAETVRQRRSTPRTVDSAEPAPSAKVDAAYVDALKEQNLEKAIELAQKELARQEAGAGYGVSCAFLFCDSALTMSSRVRPV